MNFYKSAALALDHLDKHQGSVKGSLAAAGIKTASPGESKRLLALVIETLKYRPVFIQLLTAVPLTSLERETFPRKTPPRQPTSSSLIQVLLHDLLFSAKGKIEASDKWPPKLGVARHQARLKAELVRIQLREGKSRKEDLGKVSGETEGGRYVRFNPNIDASRSEDFSLHTLHAHLSIKGFTKLDKPVFPVPLKSYFMDGHLPEVLVFSPSTNWWIGDKWYESGAIILQDKASCMPAKVLMEGWDGEGDCLDATAAPGNKTSYVSALMGNKGKLYAFERSEGRYKTLEKMLARAGCKNVLPRRADFLDSDPDDKQFAHVTRMLLDPSCSGSGIVNRLDYLVEGEADETDAKAERLEKLAAFQLQMILHAYKFPSLKRIVYSTCSVHAEEDEHVVSRALASSIAKQRGWTLAQRNEVIPTWSRRGRVEEMAGNEEMAEGVIRCLPEDHTNGFFVACFVRGSPATSQPSERKSKKRARQEETRDVTEDVKASAEEENEADTVAVEQSTTSPETEKKEQKTPAIKSAAQAERARRKKQLQKQRKKQKTQ